MILGVSITCLLTSCKSSQGQAGQPAITVTFDLLGGFNYNKDPMPEMIKALNGQRVAVTGFMLPTDFDSEKGTVKSFLLLRNQMGCCFGITPRINDFVDVEMRGGRGAKYIMDIPITVVGKFEVGKKPLVNSIYRIEAENFLVTDGF
jgi:hypothetical protein